MLSTASGGGAAASRGCLLCQQVLCHLEEPPGLIVGWTELITLQDAPYLVENLDNQLTWLWWWLAGRSCARVRGGWGFLMS
jgi:hypothetical protein